MKEGGGGVRTLNLHTNNRILRPRRLSVPVADLRQLLSSQGDRVPQAGIAPNLRWGDLVDTHSEAAALV